METESEWHFVKNLTKKRRKVRWFIGLEGVNRSHSLSWLSESNACVNETSTVKGYLVGFLKGKEGRISCRRQKIKGNYRKLAANSLPTRKGYKNVIKPYERSGKFYRDITIISPSPPQAIKNDHYLWFSYRSVFDIDECAVDNGGCSYGCQNLQGRYICTCPIGFELDRTQKNCKGI